jgi:ABC-type bacteriocin/lantibiotic exporter with double-glycine peptidase domain
LQQLNAVECGAACLAMVLSYHGRATRVAELREQLTVGRDGASALALANAARNLGLRVKAFSVEPSALGRVPLPAIVHWEFNHFLVVERWSENAVEVVDPASGRRTLTPEEFSAGFTGIVLVLEPGVNFERRRPPDAPAGARTSGQYARNLRGMALAIWALRCSLQLLGLVLPLFTQTLVDEVIPFNAGYLLHHPRLAPRSCC